MDITCDECDGDGYEHRLGENVVCGKCDGTGKIAEERRRTMNSTKPDSSPLPWVVEKQACSRLYMLLDNDGSIAVSNLTLEDAELICRAVNSRAALVEALEYARAWLDDAIHHREPPIHVLAHRIDNGLGLIDAALAAANGETK